MEHKRLTLFAGHYGSGKTEFSVNLALSLKEKYEKTVLPNTGLFIRRDISFVLGLFAFATLTTVDFYIDGVNVVPDTLTALIFIWTFLKLKPYYKNYKLGAIFSAVYGVLTVVGSSLSYDYVNLKVLHCRIQNLFNVMI